jgi:hypothetical protein
MCDVMNENAVGFTETDEEIVCSQGDGVAPLDVRVQHWRRSL